MNPETLLASSNRIWVWYGSCRTEDPDLFFPEGKPGSPLYDRDVEKAKAICAACPVRTECLAWAIDTHQVEGVWGGSEEHERTAWLRKASAEKSLPDNRYPTNTQAVELIIDSLLMFRRYEAMKEHDKEQRHAREAREAA